MAIRWQAILSPVLVSLLLFGGLMALYVAKNGGSVDALLCVGRNRAGVPPYEMVRSPIGPNGYDGQFYYAIARDPWRTHLNSQIDHPPARHLRMLYPFLCWLCSGGDRLVLFWVMPAINLVCLAGLTALGAWFALQNGRSPWWGLSLPLFLNSGLPALHNLTDTMTTLALAGMLIGWLTGAPAWVVTLAGLGALFGREQNLAVVGVVALAAAWQRRWAIVGGLTLAVSFWLTWVMVLRWAYGAWPFITGPGVFEGPFQGLWYRLSHPGGNDRFSLRLSFFLMAALAHLVIQMGLALVLVVRARDFVLSSLMLGGIALAAVAGTPFFGDFWSYTRVFVWIPLGIWLIALPRRWDVSLWLLAPACVWPIAAALGYV